MGADSHTGCRGSDHRVRGIDCGECVPSRSVSASLQLPVVDAAHGGGDLASFHSRFSGSGNRCFLRYTGGVGSRGIYRFIRGDHSVYRVHFPNVDERRAVGGV